MTFSLEWRQYQHLAEERRGGGRIIEKNYSYLESMTLY